MVKDIFKIEPIKGTVKIDGRKTISPHNSAKSLKYADLPALCNDCVYRSEEAGGNGKCPKYEKDAACAVRADFVAFLDQINTRDPEDLKALLDMLAKQSFENVMIALFQARMDGNIPDRNAKAEINTFLNIVKTTSELSDKIVVTEKKTFSKEGDISEIYRSVLQKKRDDMFGTT